MAAPLACYLQISARFLERLSDITPSALVHRVARQVKDMVATPENDPLPAADWGGRERS
jgi:hypothetical protein